jgi:hypothetical protein
MEKQQITELVTTLARSIFPALDGASFSPREYFCNLGASSVDRMLLIDAVLNSLSLNIHPFHLADSNNIECLVDLIYEHQMTASTGNSHYPKTSDTLV